MIHLLHVIQQQRYEDKDRNGLIRVQKPVDTKKQASPWKFKLP